MDYKDYYKKISVVADDYMEKEKFDKPDKEKGFLRRPTEEKPTEENPLEIVAKYMAFFRKDAIKALEEVGVNADFIKGDIAKRLEEENGKKI